MIVASRKSHSAPDRLEQRVEWGGHLLLPLNRTQKSYLEWVWRGGCNGLVLNVSLCIRFRGPFSCLALSRAVALVARRHQGLRMRLVHTDGKLQQYFEDPVDSYELPSSPLECIEEVEEYIAKSIETPMDLHKDGPLCAELLKLADEDHVLVLIVHHSATDAYADDLYIRELLTAYGDYAQDRLCSLPPATNFAEFVVNEVEAGEELTDSQLRYWTNEIRGSTPLIPCSRTGSPRLEGHGRCFVLSTTPQEMQQLEAFGSAAKVSLATVLYMAIVLAACKEYVVEDASLLMGYSGRSSPSLKALGASTVSAFQLRIVVDRTSALRDVARQVQSKMIRGAMNAMPPFTHARAVSQVWQSHCEQNASSGEGTVKKTRVPLCVVDAMTICRELQSPVSGLSVERVMPGVPPKEQFELTANEGAPFPGRGLGILLRRDLTAELGQPVSFVAAFHTGCVEESDARALLNTILGVCRLLGPDRLRTPVGEIFV